MRVAMDASGAGSKERDSPVAPQVSRGVLTSLLAPLSAVDEKRCNAMRANAPYFHTADVESACL